jgi:2-hydroxy-4-carboxymuconate semialdehyde hemiacetal dehydrogenase
MRVAVAGAGAFGLKHLDALQQIDGVEIAAVVSRRVDQARDVALTYGAPLATDELDDVLGDASIDAVILCTPTQLHAEQALATMRAGKHVQIEIPLADCLSDALAVAALARETGLTCMVGHTRRFNPSHQ